MTIGGEQLVSFYQQNTSKKEHVLWNTSQWLLLMHFNGIKLSRMVWKFCFPKRANIVGFPLKCYFQCYFILKYNRRLFRRDNNYTHQFVFEQAKCWRWIPLHSSCIMHEHIFFLPDWGMFSSYRKSGSFHYYKKVSSLYPEPSYSWIRSFFTAW